MYVKNTSKALAFVFIFAPLAFASFALAKGRAKGAKIKTRAN
jgi:hypothetical protein